MKTDRHIISNRKVVVRTRLMIALLFYCSAVGFTPRDRRVDKTWVDALIGLGSYTHIVRDCNGNRVQQDQYPYIDGGISAKHTFGIGIVTAQLGDIHIRRNTKYKIDTYQGSPSDDFSLSSIYGGASIGLDGSYAGVEIGLLYFDNPNNHYLPIKDSRFQPTGKLRLGFEDSWYFSVGLLDNPALLAQGGVGEAGFGFQFVGTKSSLWSGLAAGPYDGVHFVLRTSIEPTNWQTAILLSGDIGWPKSGPEYGFSAGVRVKFQ